MSYTYDIVEPGCHFRLSTPPKDIFSPTLCDGKRRVFQYNFSVCRKCHRISREIQHSWLELLTEYVNVNQNKLSSIQDMKIDEVHYLVSTKFYGFMDISLQIVRINRIKSLPQYDLNMVFSPPLFAKPINFQDADPKRFPTIDTFSINDDTIHIRDLILLPDGNELFISLLNEILMFLGEYYK